MDIVHQLPMRAHVDEVWRALEHAGLPSAKNGVTELCFGRVRAALRLIDLEPRARLAWRCVAGPPDWVGTDVVVDLASDGDETIVRLRHRHWREANDAMGHSCTRWAWLLFGLKTRVETPEAEDLWA